MTDIKKFTAFLSFNNEFRNLYYDLAENRGIISTWDVYHVQEGMETISEDEIEIMEEIFNSRIINDKKVFDEYESSSQNFREKVRKKLETKLH